MRVEDWPRVEEMFHAALSLGGAERDAFLARECGGDASLRRYVESMISALEANGSFMEQPAVDDAMRVLSEAPAKSLVGSTVGHYKVVRLLGRGGMGDVYLAEDLVLERPVALKFISSGLVGDAWAREQLTQEARAVARLEHTNICAVHGFEEADGRSFIVMQYVEGETLSSHLQKTRPEPSRTLDLAEQIASALSAAHARGVVHRDVKPQNVIVTNTGQVKVLDFGLAKFVRPKQDTTAASTHKPGVTAHAGLVIGTLAYMSPEQARGEALDARSDIFSFGVLLHEMLSGTNPFLRDTEEETVEAVKGEEAPPIVGLPQPLRGRIERVLRKCTQKNRALRYETADEMLRDLRAARTRPLPLARIAAVFAAIVLALASAAAYVYVSASKVHTLAVLPITNASEDHEADYLSEGLTRSLSDRFSYLPRLRVRLPSALPPSHNSREDLARIGRDLKADAVLSGRILKSDDSLKLELGLLDVDDASRDWNATFNLSATSSFALQDEVTREVASRVGLWLIGPEARTLTRHQTDSEEALKLYMRGRYVWSLKRNRENIQEAIRLFEQAKELDPSFAKAYTGLADCYALTSNVLYGPVSNDEAMEKARYNARQALALDDSLAEAHTSMGVIKLRFDWDWPGAEQEFSRAIKLDPEYAPARFWYSNLLAARGQFDESIRESEEARKFDPYSPIADMNYGRALYYARRFDEAEAYLRKKIEEKPDFPQLRHMMGYVLLQLGRIDEAIDIFEKLPPSRRLYSAAALGHAYGRAGRERDALRMLGELDEFSKNGEFVPPFEKAVVYIGMGRKDEAFALLNEAYEQRTPNLAYLLTEPAYDTIRADPRFVELTRRVNLTP